MRVTLITFSILLYFVISTSQLLSDEDAPQWKVGEELTYKVKWAFLRLGTLRAVISDTVSMDNERVYHIRVHVDSNPTLFFVNHHAVYETYFSDDLKVFLFQGNEKIDGVPYKAEYRFDYTDSLIHVTMTDEKNPSKQIRRKTPFRGQLFDGASLLYYARANAHFTRTDTVQYLDDGNSQMAILHFMGPKESLKIKALKEPLLACYLEGQVMGEGIAGLKGKFKGWFAGDKQSPPLKAKMKVFIGSVTLELESWKKWRPVQE